MKKNHDSLAKTGKTKEHILDAKEAEPIFSVKKLDRSAGYGNCGPINC